MVFFGRSFLGKLWRSADPARVENEAAWEDAKEPPCVHGTWDWDLLEAELPKPASATSCTLQQIESNDPDASTLGELLEIDLQKSCNEVAGSAGSSPLNAERKDFMAAHDCDRDALPHEAETQSEGKEPEPEPRSPAQGADLLPEDLESGLPPEAPDSPSFCKKDGGAPLFSPSFAKAAEPNDFGDGSDLPVSEPSTERQDLSSEDVHVDEKDLEEASAHLPPSSQEAFPTEKARGSQVPSQSHQVAKSTLLESAKRPSAGWPKRWWEPGNVVTIPYGSQDELARKLEKRLAKVESEGEVLQGSRGVARADAKADEAQAARTTPRAHGAHLIYAQKRHAFFDFEELEQLEKPAE